jgi:hypothetical protein
VVAGEAVTVGAASCAAIAAAGTRPITARAMAHRITFIVTPI